MICHGIWASKSPCAGAIRGYKFSDWPAPVTFCDRHFREMVKGDYTVKGELAEPKREEES